MDTAHVDNRADAFGCRGRTDSHSNRQGRSRMGAQGHTEVHTDVGPSSIRDTLYWRSEAGAVGAPGCIRSLGRQPGYGPRDAWVVVQVGAGRAGRPCGPASVIPPASAPRTTTQPDRARHQCTNKRIEMFKLEVDHIQIINLKQK